MILLRVTSRFTDRQAIFSRHRLKNTRLITLMHEILSNTNYIGIHIIDEGLLLKIIYGIVIVLRHEIC